MEVICIHYHRGETAEKVERICRDKDDDHILANALRNKIDIIITGDKDLLVLSPYKSIRILSPSDFIKKYL